MLEWGCGRHKGWRAAILYVKYSTRPAKLKKKPSQSAYVGRCLALLPWVQSVGWWFCASSKPFRTIARAYVGANPISTSWWRRHGIFWGGDAETDIFRFGQKKIDFFIPDQKKIDMVFFRFTLDAEIARKNAVLVKGPANLVSVMQSEAPGARWASLHLMPTTPKCRSNLSTVSVPLVSLPNTCKMMAFWGDKRGAWMAVPHQTPMVPRCRRRIFFILSASWLTLCGTQARYSKGFFRWRQHKTKARRWSLMHWLRFWRNEIA